MCLLVYAQSRTIARTAGEFLCRYYFTDELIEAAKKMTVPKGVCTCTMRCIPYVRTYVHVLFMYSLHMYLHVFFNIQGKTRPTENELKLKELIRYFVESSVS